MKHALATISRLQYSPCTHAIGLRRANGGDSPQSLVHLGTLVVESAKPPVSDSQHTDRQSCRLRVLEGEYKRVGRAIAELSRDLEKLSMSTSSSLRRSAMLCGPYLTRIPVTSSGRAMAIRAVQRRRFSGRTGSFIS
jgi:hypothetical protein